MLELAQLPPLNAFLNGTSGVQVLAGYVAMRRGRIPVHRAFMLYAVAVSTRFLVSYLIYHFNFPVRPYEKEGALRRFYYGMLFTHAVLAAGLVPLALITI